ncbi:desmoplakin-like isoform X2 [Pseudorasbora parva]|uniref:desmoplakin-like isoform X2 n=1 Tax=Pseudorasbora parva TaxID=51549 RepID=UPI00351E3C88
MELQKVSSEEEITRLRRQVLELEASLSNRQQQLDILGADLDMQKKSIEDLTLQKSKAEYEVQKYRVELEGVIKSKGSVEQELNRARQQVQQSEVKQASLEESLRNLKKSIEESTLARKKLEDHLRRKDSDVQGLEEHSRTLERELRAKGDAEAELLSQVRIMEMDLAHKSDVRMMQGESLLGFSKEGAQLSTFSTNSSINHSETEADVLQRKMEELIMGKKRAENEIKTLKSELNSIIVHKTVAEEKAQRFKELLDEANNRLLKLQVEMDADRSNMRQKAEELRQESSELKKSVYVYQEQIKSLQRDKSALEQRVLFQKTEVDGIKDQLKVNQGKLLQRTSLEQESAHKLRCLEDELSSKQTEVEQMTFKVNELNRKNQLLESDTRHLKVSIESIQQDKSHADQKIKTLKGEVEVLREQLQRAKEEINLKTRTEKEAQLKIKNLELELQKSSLQGTQLAKKVEELKKINMDTERSIKNVKAEIDRASIEIDSKEQQINILRSQAESAKSQVKIFEEELLNKAQVSHELQIKLKDYNEEAKKTTELQQKIKTLTLTITNYEKDISNLKSELSSVTTERNLANQKVQEHKVEINNLNITLKKAIGESQRESSEGKKSISKVRELENELLKCKQTINRISGSSEKATVSLKQDISSLQRDKQTADQKLQVLKCEFDDLSSTLKRTKDELKRVTEENRLSQSKIKEFEAELQRKSSVMRELSSNADKSVLNLKQELVTFQKDRNAAEDKITSLTLQTSELKQKLRQTQEELKQKQNQTATAELRSQKLAEQLDNCKKMLDDLKGKLDLQKKGYETQLRLVQAEMEQKLSLQESRLKLELERKSKDHSHTVETAERDNKHLSQEVEKLKALISNATKAKEEAEQHLCNVRTQLDESDRQRGILDLEVLKAKSKISELETEKIRVKSSIFQLDNIHKDSSNEISRLKQMLAETGQKLDISEREAKSLKEQIVSYIKDMKSLQEKNLKLEVAVNSEQKHLKELEALGQANHQCAKDEDLAKLKTELQLTQKIVASYEEAKQNLEEELTKMKMSSEIATLEKEKVLEELQKVKQTKMQVINEGTLENATKKTENLITLPNSNAFEIHTNQAMVGNSQSDITDTILRKSSIDKSRSGKSQTVSFNINDSESSLDLASDSPISKSKGLKMESSSQKIQGLRGRISIKKLIKTKIITQEIALKLQTGLITMEEIEASLAQFVGKPSSIAGVYMESSKKKLSFLDAVAGGLISKTYASEFLEAQAATGYIIDPMTGEGYSPSDAFENSMITDDLKDKISDAYKAVSGYTHAGKILSVFQAMEERILDRHRGKAIMETQIATGGLIHPSIGSRVPMDCALEQGLINQATLQSLYDPVSNPKDFHYPETGQKAYYSELLRICVYDVNGGVYLLPFGDQHLFTLSPSSKHRISVINTSNGAKMSAYEAYKVGQIDKRMYLFLSQQESEWQEVTIMDSSRNLLHILTDHKTGRQLCIENALSLKILQTEELNSYRSGQLSISEFADLLISRRVVFNVSNCPVAGLWDVSLKKRLPVFKGHQQNLVDRLTALRLLEAQACTGGICDPASGERVLITEAQHRGLLDEGFARQIQQCEQAYYGIIHPQNGKTLTVAQAMQENLFPKDVALRCLEFQLATGGLVNPESQERVSLEDGIQNCLIDKATAAHLQHDNSHSKCITCPKTKRKMSFKEALEKSVFDSHTGFVLLEVTKPYNMSNTSSFQYFWTYRQF